MLTVRRVLDIAPASSLPTNHHRRAIGAWAIAAAVTMALTGCGQKGTLYLAASDDPAVAASAGLSDTWPDVASVRDLPDDEAQDKRRLASALAEADDSLQDY